MSPINVPITTETISKRTHLPLRVVKSILQWLAKRGLATQTTDGSWKATPEGEEHLEEEETRNAE